MGQRYLLKELVRVERIVIEAGELHQHITRTLVAW